MLNAYTIMWKDIPVFSISKKQGLVTIHNKDLLPFDIFLEEDEDFDTQVNNKVNFNSWAASRILNLDRTYAHEILNHFNLSQKLTDADKAQIAIQTRCVSLNDNFWLKESDENISWDQINLFDNTLSNTVFDIALFGSSPTITNISLVNPDIATDGTAPKAWLRKDNSFLLLKGNKGNSDNVIREVEASEILRDLGLSPVIYWKDTYKEEPVSVCKCFTDKDTSFVRAEWFNIWCMNQDKDISDYIYTYKEQFNKMVLADFLIGNSDEHSQNWGFLYHLDNKQFIIDRINPHMDFDHAFTALPTDKSLPNLFLNQHISQMEAAMDIIKRHPDYINFDADLSKYKYGSFTKQRLDILKNHLYSHIQEKVDVEEPDV